MVKNKIGKIGAKGPAVKQIQYQVTPSDSGNQYGTGDGCGNGSSKCTGIYDAKTKELVKTWQKDYGLKADGLWGKESQRYLESATDEKEDESDID
jgi:murein L,D-transpeptidase YcbB/YkuD